MMRNFVRLDDSNYTDIKNYDLLEIMMFDEIWPDVIARKTITGDFNYGEDIKAFLCEASKLSWEVIDTVIQGLRRWEYYDFLRQFVSLIIDRSELASQQEILTPDFIKKVDKRIIFNRRNKKTNKIAQSAYELVSQMIDNNGNGFFNCLRLLSISQVKTVIAYIIITHMILYMTMRNDGKISFAS